MGAQENRHTHWRDNLSALVTTRNLLLDEISRGNSLSSAYANAWKQQKFIIRKLKHFGDVDSGYNVEANCGRSGHAVFGSAEQLLKSTGSKLS